MLATDISSLRIQTLANYLIMDQFARLLAELKGDRFLELYCPICQAITLAEVTKQFVIAQALWQHCNQEAFKHATLADLSAVTPDEANAAQNRVLIYVQNSFKTICRDILLVHPEQIDDTDTITTLLANPCLN